MSEGSSPRPPVPLATWNSARGVWETPQASLLCAHSVPYSAPWPTSGSMRAGVCFAPPTSEPHTAESGFSSSPGHLDGSPLLKSPTSNLGANWGSQHPAKRKQGGHGPNLADEVEWLLPTPKAGDGTEGSPNQRHGNGDLTLPSAAARLRPTLDAPPTRTAGRGKGATSRSRLTQSLPLLGDPEPRQDGPRPGDRTPPRSPAGNAPPVPHRGPPTTPVASVHGSWSGCKAFLPAG